MDLFEVGLKVLVPVIKMFLHALRYILKRNVPTNDLVEVERPVRGQEDDAFEALDLGEQLRHRGGAAVAALREQRLALVEEDDRVVELGLPHGKSQERIARARRNERWSGARVAVRNAAMQRRSI